MRPQNSDNEKARIGYITARSRNGSVHIGWNSIYRWGTHMKVNMARNIVKARPSFAESSPVYSVYSVYSVHMHVLHAACCALCDTRCVLSAMRRAHTSCASMCIWVCSCADMHARDKSSLKHAHMRVQMRRPYGTVMSKNAWQTTSTIGKRHCTAENSMEDSIEYLKRIGTRR